MYSGLHVKCLLLFLRNINETWVLTKDFQNIHIISHNNPSNGSQVVPREQKQTDQRTDTMKLVVAPRNFVNAPEKTKIKFLW
jgi:hypothetical protein